MKAVVAGKKDECDREIVVCGRWHQIKCLSFHFPFLSTICFSEDTELLPDNKESELNKERKTN